MENKKNDLPLVICPECGEPSDSIKSYKLPELLLFLVFYARISQKHYVCCPHCMRKHIGIKCFTYNILSGNLLWIIIGLPWGIIDLIRSTTKGHSQDVYELIHPDTPKNNEIQ